MKNVDHILEKWGEKASFIRDDAQITADAIIQPMNRKWRTYLSGERIVSGVLNNNHFFMMASPRLDSEKISGALVECSDKKYKICSCGDFKVKDKKLYVWAVLAARTELLEDDYD